MYVLMILEANRHSESSSVKMRLKEKKTLQFMARLDRYSIWVFNIFEYNRYHVWSWFNENAIMNYDLMKSSLPKAHSKKPPKTLERYLN